MISVILLAVNLFVPNAAAEKCRALSIEGGGSHGAYEIGALYELTQHLTDEDLAYNVVVGISTGALNAAGLAQFPPSETKEAAKTMLDLWSSITGNDEIYTDWPGGRVYAIVGRPSLYTSTPLRDFVFHQITRPIAKNITIGTTNLNTGKLTNFNESLGFPELLNGVICSGSPPFFFPPQYFQGSWWADGGCVINQDVFSAVTRCLEVVGDEKDVIVDQLFDDNVQPLDVKTEFNTMEVFGRVQAIQKWDKKKWYDINAKIAYPNVNWRYTIWPTQELPAKLMPLDFRPASVQECIEIGRSDARKALNNTDAAESRRRFEEMLYKDRIFYAQNI